MTSARFAAENPPNFEKKPPTPFLSPNPHYLCNYIYPLKSPLFLSLIFSLAGGGNFEPTFFTKLVDAADGKHYTNYHSQLHILGQILQNFFAVTN